jgi:hypothetical protein
MTKMANRMPAVIYLAIIGVLGLFVLILAFLLLAHFTVLSNIGANRGSGFALVSLVGGVAYLVALRKVVMSTQKTCRWCHFYCAGYAAYVAMMYGYLSYGNFMRAIEIDGWLDALSSHSQTLVFIVTSFAFMTFVLLNLNVRKSSQ